MYFLTRSIMLGDIQGTRPAAKFNGDEFSNAGLDLGNHVVQLPWILAVVYRRELFAVRKYNYATECLRSRGLTRFDIPNVVVIRSTEAQQNVIMFQIFQSDLTSLKSSHKGNNTMWLTRRSLGPRVFTSRDKLV